MVPNTVFIDPQLAQVGLNETEARKRGLDIRVAKMGMDSVARALEVSESRGFMKVIVDTSGVETQLGNKGLVFHISDNGTYKGKLRIGQATVEWCPGRTRLGNGTHIPMVKFIELLTAA